jgi:branched-chain amino acid transport system substrate-binding protein
VARWQDSADGGKGGWVSQVPDMNKNCFDAHQLAYSP